MGLARSCLKYHGVHNLSKAPISLGCDEFAMGLRIDSPNCCETVAKRSHGIAKSLHASRTRHERVAKVLNV